MRFAELEGESRVTAAESLRAVIAAILAEDPATMPVFEGVDPAAVGMVSRWLGRLGLGAMHVADPVSFSWPGPWIGRIRPPASGERFMLVSGTPSGAIWDPAGDGTPVENESARRRLPAGRRRHRAGPAAAAGGPAGHRA